MFALQERQSELVINRRCTHRENPTYRITHASSFPRRTACRSCDSWAGEGKGKSNGDRSSRFALWAALRPFGRAGGRFAAVLRHGRSRALKHDKEIEAVQFTFRVIANVRERADQGDSEWSLNGHALVVGGFVMGAWGKDAIGKADPLRG
jgi:hypothetical protein